MVRKNNRNLPIVPIIRTSLRLHPVLCYKYEVSLIWTNSSLWLFLRANMLVMDANGDSIFIIACHRDFRIMKRLGIFWR